MKYMDGDFKASHIRIGVFFSILRMLFELLCCQVLKKCTLLVF